MSVPFTLLGHSNDCSLYIIIKQTLTGAPSTLATSHAGNNPVSAQVCASVCVCERESVCVCVSMLNIGHRNGQLSNKLH